MIFKINDLYINTDGIVTICPYTNVTENSTQAGLIINDTHYPIYHLQASVTEKELKLIEDAVLVCEEAIVGAMANNTIKTINFEAVPVETGDEEDAKENTGSGE